MMKLLLDENGPVKLKHRFTEKGINPFTLRDMRWLGKKNGGLLKAMIEKDFTLFITVDNNLTFQNNFKNYPIAVMLLIAPDNTYETIMKCFDEILNSLKENFVRCKVIFSN